MNPVARRELQERFRTLRSPIQLTIWVFVVGGITFLAYVIARAVVRDSFFNFGLGGVGTVVATASMGRFILHALFLGMLTALVFVVPGQAAVAIVGERERQTLPLLQVSQLSAGRIVLGKLASALAYIVLLLIASTPLLVVPVLLGGVTILQVLAGVGMVAAAALLFGSVSLWVSARARSMQSAVLGSYLWTAAIIFGTGLLLVAELLLVDVDTGATRFDIGYPRDDGRELYTAWVNPYFGLVDATTDVLKPTAELIGSPYAPFRSVLLKRQGFAGSSANELFSPWFTTQFGRDVFFDGGGFVEEAISLPAFGGDVVAQGAVDRFQPIRMRLWWKTLLIEVGISAAALWAAARHIRVPRKNLRRRRLPKAEVADAS